jgi:hypothetical protein
VKSDETGVMASKPNVFNRSDFLTLKIQGWVSQSETQQFQMLAFYNTIAPQSIANPGIR